MSIQNQILIAIVLILLGCLFVNMGNAVNVIP